MAPQATTVVPLSAAEEAESGDGFAMRFFPLIPTFSHPGEGARYVAALTP